MVDATIRSLNPADLAKLLDWAAREGWNPGLADADLFGRLDPQGYIGCFVDGALAAGIAAIAYDDRFGFIGLYICRPDLRGRGYGRLVWDAALSNLDHRTVGLDGVPEQQANYAAMGFAPFYQTIRWSGRAMSKPGLQDTPATAVQPVETADIPDLCGYDERCFPAKRREFLSAWLRPPHQALAAREGNRVTGYAVLRRCREGRKIGPLFADDDQTAEHLLAACIERALGDGIHIDVPDYQVGLAETLRRLCFQPGFTTARMYRGTPPRISLASVYAITTLELG